MTDKPTKIRIAKGARKRGPFSTIEEAIAATKAGRMVIVVDDEDRENEGDLTMAASKVTPEAINFMAKHGRGQICLSMTRAAARRARDPAGGLVQHHTVRDRVLRADRRQAQRDDRHLGGRSRRHGPRGDRPEDDGRRPGAARSHVAAAIAGRRRAGARRADRGGGRSGADGRSLSGRRHLRNHERGRHDGPRAGADEVREEARSADDHDRGPDPVPHAHGAAGQARGACGAADRARRLPDLCLREPARSGRRTSRWCAARSATARTCLFACTRSA